VYSIIKYNPEKAELDPLIYIIDKISPLTIWIPKQAPNIKPKLYIFLKFLGTPKKVNCLFKASKKILYKNNNIT